MATVRGSPGAIGSEVSAAPTALRTRGALGFAAVVAVVLLPLAVVLVSDRGGELASALGPRHRGDADRPRSVAATPRWWAPTRATAGTTPARCSSGPSLPSSGASVRPACLLAWWAQRARRSSAPSSSPAVGGGLPLGAGGRRGARRSRGRSGRDLLADPWNPWAAVLPFFTFVLLAGTSRTGRSGRPVARRGRHVPRADPRRLHAVGAGARGGRRAARSRGGPAPVGRTRRGRGICRAPAAASPRLAVAAVLWIPPVVQQLFGAEGTCTAILRFVCHRRSRSSDGEPPGGSSGPSSGSRCVARGS